MAHVELDEQTFRDGQQSLWGYAPAGRHGRGGRRPARQRRLQGGRDLRQLADGVLGPLLAGGPLGGLDLWRRWMPNSELRSPVCQNRIGTFGMTPDSLMGLWWQTLIKHGIDCIWVYDCLYNMGQMRRLCGTIAAAGGRALGAIMYGISPVHTDEWWAPRVAEMCSWPEVAGIYFEDAPGILTPERAETLMPALLKAACDRPSSGSATTTTPEWGRSTT
jgi:oxaloacetate decarboxylase alpha subunit